MPKETCKRRNGCSGDISCSFWNVCILRARMKEGAPIRIEGSQILTRRCHLCGNLSEYLQCECVVNGCNWGAFFCSSAAAMEYTSARGSHGLPSIKF